MWLIALLRKLIHVRVQNRSYGMTSGRKIENWSVIWCSKVWCFWNQRNSCIFRNIQFEKEMTMQRILFTGWTWLKSFGSGFVCSFSQYLPREYTGAGLCCRDDVDIEQAPGPVGVQHNITILVLLTWELTSAWLVNGSTQDCLNGSNDGFQKLGVLRSSNQKGQNPPDITILLEYKSVIAFNFEAQDYSIKFD